MSEKPKTNPSQPRKLRDVAQWDRETDVAIVGFGGAGGCAAIEAADAGSSVIIFELASSSGGSTALSSAEIYMGGNGGTRVQQACGLTAAPISSGWWISGCPSRTASTRNGPSCA
jgi:NADPH-dependent 2,4-dienoyl-CoA reductase/sulfur reductase-like enzyme